MELAERTDIEEATQPQGRALTLFNPTSPADMVRRVQEMRTYVKQAMVKGIHYDVIPHTDKPTLLKSGAEDLCIYYQLTPVAKVTHRIEDWDTGFFHYEVSVDLLHRVTGQVMGTGIGSCNSKEDRYRWRTQEPTCPKCGQLGTIIKGKEVFGGGWLCWNKRGGCGAKFDDAAPEIIEQPRGKVENPEPYTLVNTLQKMAKKRAFVDAVLTTTGSSMIFTQDVEDFIAGSSGNSASQPAAAANSNPMTQQRNAKSTNPAQASVEHSSKSYKPSQSVQDWQQRIEKTNAIEPLRGLYKEAQTLFAGEDWNYLGQCFKARSAELKEAQAIPATTG